MNIFRTSAITALVIGSAMLMSAQGKKISRSDLPPAVEKALSTQSNGATIKGLSQEKEHGHTYYEAEMLKYGHSKDVLFDRDGKVVEVEEQVDFDNLPADVKAGLQSKTGAGKIRKVESLNKLGKLVAYEAQVTTGGKHSEIQVGPDGKPLAHEE